jgi:hypothetical protein
MNLIDELAFARRFPHMTECAVLIEATARYEDGSYPLDSLDNDQARVLKIINMLARRYGTEMPICPIAMCPILDDDGGDPVDQWLFVAREGTSGRVGDFGWPISYYVKDVLGRPGLDTDNVCVSAGSGRYVERQLFIKLMELASKAELLPLKDIQ